MRNLICMCIVLSVWVFVLSAEQTKQDEAKPQPQAVEKESGQTLPAKDREASERDSGIMRTIQWQQSYVADAENELPNHQTDGFSVIGGSVSFQVRLPELLDATLMRGAGWRYYLFRGTRSGSPIPDELHAVYLNLGLDLKLDESWRLRFALEPGIYSDMEDLSYHDLNAPGSITLSYSSGRDFTIAFGLRVQPMGDIPVMPFVGLSWCFAERWTLNLLGGLRIEYQVTDDASDNPLKIYAGLDMAGGTFRLARDFGDMHGQRELNNVWLSYHEMRAVLGVSGGIPFGDGDKGTKRSLTWDAQAGYMFYRMLNYDKEERLQNEEGAVYVSGGITARF